MSNILAHLFYYPASHYYVNLTLHKVRVNSFSDKLFISCLQSENSTISKYWIIQTGFVTLTKEYNYSDGIDLVVSDNYEYTWFMGNYGELKSVRLDGSVSTEGIFVLLVSGESNYRIRYLLEGSRTSEVIERGGSSFFKGCT